MVSEIFTNDKVLKDLKGWLSFPKVFWNNQQLISKDYVRKKKVTSAFPAKN